MFSGRRSGPKQTESEVRADYIGVSRYLKPNRSFPALPARWVDAKSPKARGNEPDHGMVSAASIRTNSARQWRRSGWPEIRRHTSVVPPPALGLDDAVDHFRCCRHRGLDPDIERIRAVAGVMRSAGGRRDARKRHRGAGGGVRTQVLQPYFRIQRLDDQGSQGFGKVMVAPSGMANRGT